MSGVTGYAIVTGHLPIINAFTSSPASDSASKVEVKHDSESSSAINPELITQDYSSSSSSAASSDPDAKIDDNSSASQDGANVEVQPIAVATTTSQGLTSAPSKPAPANSSKDTTSRPEPSSSEPESPTSSTPDSTVSSEPSSSSSSSSSSHHHNDSAPPISGVSLDKSELNLNKGNVSAALVSTITPSNATGDKTITWSTANANVATVDNTGHVTAVGAGTTQITAQTSNGKTATCKVTVSTPVSKISLSTSNLSMIKGKTFTLAASFEPKDATNQSVLWATSNSNIATINESGMVTAVSAGIATITVTTKDGNYTDKITVTVIDPSSEITLNKSAITLLQGMNESLTAAVAVKDSGNQSVTWDSSNTDIATVDDKGKITAVLGGTAMITAHYGEYIAQCSVTVINSNAEISLNKTELTLVKGTNESLSTTVAIKDSGDQSIKWDSSDTNIVAVDKDGKVTAVEGGSAMITAHYGGYIAQCNVTVTVPAAQITCDTVAIKLVKGDSQKIKPIFSPADATDKGVAWSTSNSNVAMVDEYGNITAVGAGTATITATTHDGGFTAECQVTVIPDKYTITATAEANGTTSGSGVYNYGSAATLVAIPSDHYHFVRWSDGVTTASRTVTVTADMNVTASFAIDTFTVTATAGANGTVTGSGVYNYGDTATLTATPNAHYHFTGWSDGVATASRTVTVSADMNVAASFAIDTFMVNATAGANGTVTGGGVYDYGSTATLTAMANSHYHFVSWSDGVATASRTVTVTEDVNVTANFSIDAFTVTAIAGANGTVTGSGVYNYGSTATLTATASSHYHFTGWSDGVTTASRTVTVSADMNVTASFSIDTFAVNATAGANGTVAGNGVYAYGSISTLTATPNPHYHFTGWSDGVTTAIRTVTVTQNVNLSANFAIDTFTVTATAGANGTVSGGGVYSYGTTITLTAIANEGYHLSQWSDGDTNSSIQYLITHDINLSANFVENQITWTTSTSTTGSGSSQAAERMYSISNNASTSLHAESSYYRFSKSDSDSEKHGMANIYYAFNTPYVFKAGTVIQISSDGVTRLDSSGDIIYNSYWLYTYVNDMKITSEYQDDEWGKTNSSYTIQQDTLVKNLSISICDNNHGPAVYNAFVKIILPNGKTFLLNNSGTSAQ